MEKYLGRWWLPEHPDDTVSGTLYYEPGIKIQLELIGTFGEQNDNLLAILLRSQSVDVIYGMSADGSEISLFNCSTSYSLNSRAGFPIARFSANSIVVGMHLYDIDDNQFFKAKIRIPELSYWFIPSYIEHYHLGETGNDGVQVTMPRLKNEQDCMSEQFTTPDDFSICLYNDACFHSDTFSLNLSFEQFSSLHIQSASPKSLRRFYEIVVRYEHFLSLATLRQVSYSDFILLSENCFQQVGEVKKFREIRVDTIFHAAPSTDKIDFIRFLFSYNTIHEQYQMIIKHWFLEDSEFNAIRGHFIETIDYKGPFSYINFMTVIQAVEGYGHRYMKSEIRKYKSSLDKKQKKQKTELHHILAVLLEYYKDIRCIDSALDIDLLVNTRDYHSHLFSNTKKEIADVSELYNLTNELQKLLICCILSYLGLSNSDIEQIFKSTHNTLFHRPLNVAGKQ